MVVWKRNLKCCAKFAVTKPAANIMEWHHVTVAEDFSKGALEDLQQCKSNTLTLHKGICHNWSLYTGTWITSAKKMATVLWTSRDVINANPVGSKSVCKSTWKRKVGGWPLSNLSKTKHAKVKRENGSTTYFPVDEQIQYSVLCKVGYEKKARGWLCRVVSFFTFIP